MLENEPTDTTTSTDSSDSAGAQAPGGSSAPPRRRRAASRPAGPPVVAPSASEPDVAVPAAVPAALPAADAGTPAESEPAAPPARRRTRKAAAPETSAIAADALVAGTTQMSAAIEGEGGDGGATAPRRRSRKATAPVFSAPVEPTVAVVDELPVSRAALLFQAPADAPVSDHVEAADSDESDGTDGETADGAAADTDEDDDTEGTIGADGVRRKRRRRGGRGRRRRPADGSEGADAAEGGQSGDDAEGSRDSGDSTADGSDAGDQPAAGTEIGDDGEPQAAGTKRRRRRRRGGSGDGDSADESDGTVVHVREPREPREPRESREPQRNRSSRGSGDEVTAVRGSTRLEAKKQRRREGRDAGRRRPPILSEAEFLSRREAVNRVMVIRQRGDLTQIAVLEDDVLVEHYVASASSSTMQGNVYLGKVQNVLPSMEAAFIDIGRGRNAVLYAGEVNWDAAALDGQPRRIEHVMKSGDSVLAQVTKDPLGHKGSRLTSNISLAGRFLVYVPDGSMSGISRKLPDTERGRLKAILKNVVPEDAGVIVRTAAEGATEEQLTHDVQRLQAQWDDIQKKAKTASAPSLLYGEPDLTVRVVRDLFNEDFDKLVVSGDDAWDVVQAYVMHVAPDLMDRVSKHVGTKDAFAEYRIDEQIAKGLDRKVYLPSGGSLVIDRTEAMTVVDVNTGKFVGKGSGNLEETVTRNNLEAAEEIVRQLRLRDIGGIIVVDFIDMVLESNRDLVLRRLTECLGRDRTKHQVAEVTSLGLVQMTRKRIGQGLLEAFSEPCEVCNGRGIKVHLEPIIPREDHARSSHASSGQAGNHGSEADRADKAERVARVAKVAKASKAAKAPQGEPADPGESTEPSADVALSTERSTEPAKPARSRQPRAPRAAAAPSSPEPGPETVQLTSGQLTSAQLTSAQPADAPVKAPARRRRVAKKAQGAPAPAP